MGIGSELPAAKAENEKTEEIAIAVISLGVMEPSIVGVGCPLDAPLISLFGKTKKKITKND